MTMSNLPPLVTVFGGSGFVGRHVVRALAKRGYRIRVAVRRPDLAGFLRPLGYAGQIQLVQANLRYRKSIDQAVAGADLTELEDVSFTERLAEVLQHLAAVPVTTIAAISGSCMGLGMQLAVACDIRVVDSPARFAELGVARISFGPFWQAALAETSTDMLGRWR